MVRIKRFRLPYWYKASLEDRRAAKLVRKVSKLVRDDVQVQRHGIDEFGEIKWYRRKKGAVVVQPHLGYDIDTTGTFDNDVVNGLEQERISKERRRELMWWRFSLWRKKMSHRIKLWFRPKLRAELNARSGMSKKKKARRRQKTNQQIVAAPETHEIFQKPKQVWGETSGYTEFANLVDPAEARKPSKKVRLTSDDSKVEIFFDKPDRHDFTEWTTKPPPSC